MDWGLDQHFMDPGLQQAEQAQREDDHVAYATEIQGLFSDRCLHFQISCSEGLFETADHLPGELRIQVLQEGLNELSPSQRTTMMTSNATSQDEQPVASDNRLNSSSSNSNSHINDDLTAVARSENATDDAQQGPFRRENMPPLEDIQMEEVQGALVANVMEGNVETEAVPEVDEHRRAQEEFAAPSLEPVPTPAIPESDPDVARLISNIEAIQSIPGAFEQMKQERRFIPDLIGLPQIPDPLPDIHAAAHAGIPHDGQMGIADLSGPMTSMPVPIMFGNDSQNQSFFNPQPSQLVEAEQKVQGFARIDFDDGQFYLNSYKLMIGRDLRLQKVQSRRSIAPGGSMRVSTRPRSVAYSERGGFVRGFEEDEFDEEHDRKRRRKARSSNEPNKRIKKSKSSGSSSHHHSRRPSMAPPVDVPPNHYPDTEQPAKVNIEEHQPSPHKMVTLYIHPPYPATSQDWKAISRKHLLIAFNFDKNLWEGTVMGRNGCFVEDDLKHQGETFELTNGCHLQIGAVELLFRLPEHVPPGGTGAEHHGTSDEEDVDQMADLRRYEDDARLKYVMAGKEMSLDFRNERRHTMDLEDASDSDGYGEELLDQDSQASDEDEDDVAFGQPRLFSDNDKQESDDNEENAEEVEVEDKQENEKVNEFDDVRHEAGKIPPPRTPEPKKRGVGRPPKDGISKRQQREEKAARLAKEALEKGSKKTAKDEKVTKDVKGGKGGKEGKDNKESKMAKNCIKMEPGSQPAADSGNKTGPEGGEKRKVGRPRKHPRPDTPPEPREKRKYTKRKPKEPKDGEAKADGEGGDGEKDSKEQKPPRSPRSPTPTYNEAELTEEQMAKPSCNYVQLIYEALSESTHKQMSLPQIYRAIQRKYPYFVLKVSTVGWQSSVRHNLGQNEGFEKVERDGKGWKWAIKAGATFEKEKKKKASPPPQYAPGHVQAIYPGVPHGYQMQGYPHHGMMMPPQGYHMHHQMPPNYRPPGQPQPYMGHMSHQSHINGLYQPGHQPPMTSQPTLTIPPALVPQPSTSYSSPYGPKPAASTTPATSQSDVSQSQPGSSASQPGPSTSQQGAQTSQPSTQTSQRGTQIGQSGLQATQETQASTENGQSAGGSNQPGPSTKPPVAPDQPAPSAGQTQTSPTNVQSVPNLQSQGAGSPGMPAPQAGSQLSQPPQYPHYPQSQHFSQSFPSPQSQQSHSQQSQAQPSSQSFQSQPQQAVQLQAPAQTHSPNGQQTSSHTPAPVLNEDFLKAVQSFRKALTPQMELKPNGIETLNRAVSKVLGQRSEESPDSPEEASIVVILRDMLKKIGLLPHAGASSSVSNQRSHPPATYSQNSSLQQANQARTQESAAQSQSLAKMNGSEKSSPTISRPTFTQNQSRLSGPPVPRPPMNNLGRSNSNSSNGPMRQQTPVGSPALPAAVSNGPLSTAPPSQGPSSNGASTPKPPSDLGQLDDSKNVDEVVQVKTEPVSGHSPPNSQTAETGR